MSAQVGNTCYGTDLQAAQAAASAEVGSIVVVGSKAYTVNATSITATSITYQLKEIGGTGIYSSANAFTAVPCQMLSAEDGLQMGWMVGSVWVAVFAVMFLTRGLRMSESSSYGNA